MFTYNIAGKTYSNFMEKLLNINERHASLGYSLDD